MERWALIVAIAAIVVSALIAYHIAFLQGVFGRPQFFGSFAAPAEEGLPPAPAQIVLIAVPRAAREYLVIGLPFLAQNRGKSAIKNLWINLEYERNFSVQANPPVMAVTGGVKWPDTTRTEHLADDRLRIDHELPLLRPEETMVLAEPIAFHTRELLGDPALLYKKMSIFVQTIAENAPRRKGYVKVAFTLADDLAELQSHFDEIVREINGSFAAPFFFIVISRLFRKVIRTKQCLLIVPRFRELSPAVAVDTILFGNSGTTYQTAEAGFYITQLPAAKPLTRSELKQFRKAERDENF
jgi:hypothetical protein